MNREMSKKPWRCESRLDERQLFLAQAVSQVASVVKVVKSWKAFLRNKDRHFEQVFLAHACFGGLAKVASHRSWRRHTRLI